MQRQILTNAKIIQADRVLEGSVVIENDRIAEVTACRYPEGRDLNGQWLIPGIIDIHTDYIERELRPRPSAEFPLDMAFHLMDARAIACGLTTVLGAARISGEHDGTVGGWSGDGIRLAQEYERLRRTALARHYIHVRWNPNFEPA